MASRAASRLSRSLCEVRSSACPFRIATRRLRIQDPLHLRVRYYSDVSASSDSPKSTVELPDESSEKFTQDTPSDLIVTAPVNRANAGEVSFFDGFIHEEYRATPSGRLVKKRVPRKPITVAEFHKLRPRRPFVERHKGQTDASYEAAISDATWQRTYDEISAALGSEQLRQLAKSLGIKPTSALKKTELITALIKDQFGLVSKEERIRSGAAVQVERIFPVSKRELFLLLVNGGQSLSLISPKTGVRVTPDAERQEGKEPQYSLVVTGDKVEATNDVEERLKTFKKTVKTRTHSRLVPEAGLDPIQLRNISAQTRTFIELRPDRQNEPASFRLTALTEKDLALARLHLANLQAEWFERETPLASYAAPSPLDPAYDDGGELYQRTLQHFAFLPKALPSVTSMATRASLGGENVSIFRLARVRETGFMAVDQETNKTFVGLSRGSSPFSLQAKENWQWLGRELDLSQAVTTAPALPRRLSGAEVTTTHALSIGALVFSGNITSDDEPLARLQQLLNPPLSGYWTLDTAFEWLQNVREDQGNQDAEATSVSKRPIWISDTLPHLPMDETDSLPGPVLQIVDEGSGVETEEVTRFIYQLGQKDAEKLGDWKLLIDVEEKSSTSTEIERFSYAIKSARWESVRKVNVLSPELPRDFQLSSTLKVAVDVDALQEEAPLSEYLKKLINLVNSGMVSQDSGESGEDVGESNSAVHPRHGREPVPLTHQSRVPALPPFKLSFPKPLAEEGDTSQVTVHFGTAVRLATTSYPLLPRSDQKGLENQERGTLITETLLSHQYTSAKTSSRVEWTSSSSSPTSTSTSSAASSSSSSQSQDSGENGSSSMDKRTQELEEQISSWKSRLNSLKPLLEADDREFRESGGW